MDLFGGGVNKIDNLEVNLATLSIIMIVASCYKASPAC
jgi:hypothetical protein